LGEAVFSVSTDSININEIPIYWKRNMYMYIHYLCNSKWP